MVSPLKQESFLVRPDVECGLSISNRHAEESAQLTFASFNVNGLSHEGVWHLNDLISSQQYDVSNHYPLLIGLNILLILFVILIY